MYHPLINACLLTATSIFLQFGLASYVTMCDEHIIIMGFGGVIGMKIVLAGILVEMLRVEKISSAFGNLSLVIGLGSIVEPPITGFNIGGLKDHNILTHLTATGFFISRVVGCVCAFLHNKRKNSNIDSSRFKRLMI